MLKIFLVFYTVSGGIGAVSKPLHDMELCQTIIVYRGETDYTVKCEEHKSRPKVTVKIKPSERKRLENRCVNEGLPHQCTEHRDGTLEILTSYRDKHGKRGRSLKSRTASQCSGPSTRTTSFTSSKTKTWKRMPRRTLNKMPIKKREGAGIRKRVYRCTTCDTHQVQPKTEQKFGAGKIGVPPPGACSPWPAPKSNIGILDGPNCHMVGSQPNPISATAIAPIVIVLSRC